MGRGLQQNIYPCNTKLSFKLFKFCKKKALHRFMSMRVTRAGRNSMVAPERSPLGNYKLYFFFLITKESWTDFLNKGNQGDSLERYAFLSHICRVPYRMILEIHISVKGLNCQALKDGIKRYKHIQNNAWRNWCDFDTMHRLCSKILRSLETHSKFKKKYTESSWRFSELVTNNINSILEEIPQDISSGLREEILTKS